MKTLGYKLHCSKCRKIVDVYEYHRQEKALPTVNPEFDVITVCCPTPCNKPVMKVTALHKSSNEEEEK